MIDHLLAALILFLPFVLGAGLPAVCYFIYTAVREREPRRSMAAFVFTTFSVFCFTQYLWWGRRERVGFEFLVGMPLSGLTAGLLQAAVSLVLPVSRIRVATAIALIASGLTTYIIESKLSYTTLIW